MGRETGRTRKVTDLSRLLLCDLLRGFHAIKRDQPARTSRDEDRSDRHGLPTNHSTPSFPILTAFEPGIASDELLQDGVKLVFGTKTQLQGVHKSNEILRDDRLSFTRCVANDTHLSRLSDPLASFWTSFAGVFYRCRYTDFDAM